MSPSQPHLILFLPTMLVSLVLRLVNLVLWASTFALPHLFLPDPPMSSPFLAINLLLKYFSTGRFSWAPIPPASASRLASSQHLPLSGTIYLSACFLSSPY